MSPPDEPTAYWAAGNCGPPGLVELAPYRQQREGGLLRDWPVHIDAGRGDYEAIVIGH